MDKGVFEPCVLCSGAFDMEVLAFDDDGGWMCSHGDEKTNEWSERDKELLRKPPYKRRERLGALEISRPKMAQKYAESKNAEKIYAQKQ